MFATHAPVLLSAAQSSSTPNSGLPGPSVPGHVPAGHSLSFSHSSASSPPFQFQFQSPVEATSPPAAWNSSSPSRVTPSSPPVSVVPAKRPAPVDDDDDLLDHEDPNSTQQARRRSLTTPYQNYILRAIISITRFPSTALRDSVGKAIGLTGRQVQVWFQNQRQKARKLFPDIDLDHKPFPLDDLLPVPGPSVLQLAPAAQSRPIGNDALKIIEEIATAFRNVGIGSTTQRVGADVLDVVTQYCATNGGPGPKLQTNPTAVALDRSRMPPPPVPVKRTTPGVRFVHHDAASAASGHDPRRHAHRSSHSSSLRQHEESLPYKTSEFELPPFDPRIGDCADPSVVEEHISYYRRLRTPPPPGSYPHIAPLNLPHGADGPQGPKQTVVLHAQMRDTCIPEPIHLIPREHLQRRRRGTPTWYANGPEGDAAMDPELYASLHLRGVIGRRRRPRYHDQRPPSPDRPFRPGGWVWGEDLRLEGGGGDAMDADWWEWEWDTGTMQELPSRAFRLLFSDDGAYPANKLVGRADRLGLFNWLVTGRFPGFASWPSGESDGEPSVQARPQAKARPHPDSRPQPTGPGVRLVDGDHSPPVHHYPQRRVDSSYGSGSYESFMPPP